MKCFSPKIHYEYKRSNLRREFFEIGEKNMKKFVGLLVVVLALSIVSFGQMKPAGEKKEEKKAEETKPVVVTPLTLPDGYEAGEVTGNLSNGTKLSSLRWAERSSVACFPGTRFEMFNGNHVLYRMELPAASRMTITLTPKDNKTINLYALRQGMRSQQNPPDITSAISCEAKYPIYANISKTKRVTNKDDGVRRIEYISVNSPYSILIGIAGAEGLTEGDFTLKVEIKSR